MIIDLFFPSQNCPYLHTHSIVIESTGSYRNSDIKEITLFSGFLLCLTSESGKPNKCKLFCLPRFCNSSIERRSSLMSVCSSVDTLSLSMSFLTWLTMHRTCSLFARLFFGTLLFGFGGYWFHGFGNLQLPGMKVSKHRQHVLTAGIVTFCILEIARVFLCITWRQHCSPTNGYTSVNTWNGRCIYGTLILSVK